MNDKPMNQKIEDFLRGERDCDAGHPHKPNESMDYDRGYRVQYELEQLATERTGE